MLYKKMKIVVRAEGIKARINLLFRCESQFREIVNFFLDIILPIYSCLCGSISLIWRRVFPIKVDKKAVDLAIVAIAKNEGSYIREWALFHRNVGVKKIFLYDNDSEDNMLLEIKDLIDEGFIIVHTIHGTSQQMNAYNDAFQRYGHVCEFITALDCDEFLYSTYDENIIATLRKYRDQDLHCGGIGVTWVMYGTGGNEYKEEGLVIDRFLYRAKVPGSRGTDHIKTIAIPERVVMWNNPHYPRYKTGFYTLSVSGSKVVPMWGAKQIIDEYNGIRINHYFTKSKEEYLERRSRPRADNNEIRPIEDFYEHNNNDIFDDSATKYSAAIKERM